MTDKILLTEESIGQTFDVEGIHKAEKVKIIDITKSGNFFIGRENYCNHLHIFDKYGQEDTGEAYLKPLEGEGL